MTLKKESIFNKFLIGIIILISNILNFLDFRIRTLFIVFNIVIISFVLMIYVKPQLDQEFRSDVKMVVVSNNPPPPIDKPLVIETTPPQTIPVKSIAIDENLKVNARSYIVYDLTNQVELIQKEKELTLPPASLVKMLSVMYFYSKIDLSESYSTVSECNFVEGQKVGFKKNEKVTGKDLVNSSIVFSAGDSICNLYKITESKLEGFNDYGKSLDMKNSKFTNFIGLDYPGNFTTAEDMLAMTKEYIKNDLFSQISSLKTYKMANGKVVYNTNKMLFEDSYSVGIKTGTTFGAKENLIYRYKNPNKDMDILIIIMNSSSRYQDVKNIVSALR